jgi:hypothetical protein
MKWVLTYNADRVAKDSSAVLPRQFSPCTGKLILNRTLTQAPPFPVPEGRKRATGLYRVGNTLRKVDFLREKVLT